MKKSNTRLIALLLALITLFMPASFAFAGNVTIGEAAQNVQDEALLTFEFISDTHIGVEGTDTIFENGLKAIKDANLGMDAMVISGDLTNNGDLGFIDQFYDILDANAPIDLAKIMCGTGNHDMGQKSSSYERRPVFIEKRNERTTVTSDKLYYSMDIKGYKFIIMGDEGNGVNTAVITDEQLQFIDDEIKAGAVEGKPVFVICHWPMARNHGAHFLWPIVPGGSLGTAQTKKLMAVLTKYDNVFYLSGHLHGGLNGKITKWLFNACCVEDHNGVTSVNAPSFGKSNRFGVAAVGTGMEFKVYNDKVVIIGRDYLNNKTYDKYTYTVDLTRVPA